VAVTGASDGPNIISKEPDEIYFSGRHGSIEVESAGKSFLLLGSEREAKLTVKIHELEEEHIYDHTGYMAVTESEQDANGDISSVGKDDSITDVLLYLTDPDGE
jgi:hypothetical protein